MTCSNSAKCIKEVKTMANSQEFKDHSRSSAVDAKIIAEKEEATVNLY